MIIGTKWFGWIRDGALIVGVFLAIQWWQTRDMLETDGSVMAVQANLVSLDGEVEALLVPGKRNLVYFFAPWCSVCAASIGNLDYLKDDSLNIVRVALDYDSVEAVQQFVSNNEVQGRVLLGTAQQKQQFSVPGYPAYYLVDDQSRVVSKAYGYSTAAGLKLNNYLTAE